MLSLVQIQKMVYDFSLSGTIDRVMHLFDFMLFIVVSVLSLSSNYKHVNIQIII